MKLDALMRRVLAELELLANASAGQVGVVSGGEPDHAGPPFVEDRVGYWRWRWESLDNDEARKACIRAILNEIQAVRYGREAHVDIKTRSGRTRIGTDPRPARVVAHVYGVSERHVRKLRSEVRQQAEARA